MRQLFAAAVKPHLACSQWRGYYRSINLSMRRRRVHESRSPAPVVVDVVGEVGFDEAAAVLCNPRRFVEDVVADEP
jgi:hypothetical protein